MKLKDISLPVVAVNGGIPKVILAAKAPYFDYKENLRTTEEPVGIRYTVALIGNQLSSLDVKVAGKDTTPHLTNEEIAARTAAMDFIQVEFVNSVVKFFQIKGEQIVSASAESIRLLDDDIDFGKGVM